MSEHIKIILKEDLDLSGYSDEDFMEAFVENFRPWIRKNHGDEVGKYPMSLLVKKYLEDFDKDYGLDTYLGYGNTLTKMAKVGRSLVVKGLKELPTLNRGFKFTERFNKQIQSFISNYNFPDFIKIVFDEQTPFKVWLNVVADFVPTMKYEGDLRNVNNFRNEFIHFIKNYIGFDTGSPAWGNLDLHVGDAQFENYEEWYKTFFTKKFKKEIKTIPGVKESVHSIKIEPSSSTLTCTIYLVFKRYVPYTREAEIKEKVKNYLTENGYNINRLRVSNK